MGSGTTAIAAIEEKRNYIGSEISKASISLAEKRILQHQSQIKLF
jgi:site-specific DNA-methyltransferase (adenine-specific)